MWIHIHHMYHICRAFSNIHLSRVQAHTDAKTCPYSNSTSAVKKDNQNSCSNLIQCHHLGARIVQLTPPPTHSQPPWRNSRPGGCWSYAEHWDSEWTEKTDCYRGDKASYPSVLVEYKDDRSWRHIYSQSCGGRQAHTDKSNTLLEGVLVTPLWRYSRGHSSTGVVPLLALDLVHEARPCSCRWPVKVGRGLHLVPQYTKIIKRVGLEAEPPHQPTVLHFESTVVKTSDGCRCTGICNDQANTVTKE